MSRPFAAFVVLQILLANLALAEDRRPNILYFYVDDMGFGSIGPNGQDRQRAKGLPNVRTPNLDRLARQGMNFTRGYGCFVCSPARSSQQTGFHQGHTFADRNDPDNAKKAIRRDDQTMGDVLAKAGYATGYWGKWGYGGSKEQIDPQIVNVQTLPTSHGYQDVLAELHHVRAHTFFQPTLWKAPAADGARGGLQLVTNSMSRYTGAEYPQSPALQGHGDYPSTAYCDDHYAMACLDFVRRQSISYHKTGQPFFGILACQIPHAPFAEVAKLPDWDAAYRDDPHFAKLPAQSQQWAAMVTRIDAHFGNILKALEDPNGDGDRSDSVVKNTLVVFQSDNGGPGGSNNASFASNGVLKGTKGTIHEGGIRVPLVMRLPGKVQPGSQWDEPVDVTDLLPTFCELAQQEIPLGVDGVSIAHRLTGRGKRRERDFLIHEAGNGNSIIRGNMKLVRSFKKTRRTKMPGKTQLFDLSSDPSESVDIASSHPEIVAELSALLAGEQVDQPKGFSVTFHRWTGNGQSGDALDPNNWSEYVYENEGIVYQQEHGKPSSSWIANLVSGEGSATAKAPLEFLALQLGGSDASGQSGGCTLRLEADGILTCRNELRIAQRAVLEVAGATTKTLRWIEIEHGGQLSGYGSIVGNVDCEGEWISERQGFAIHGDVRLMEGSRLQCTGAAGIKVEGTAELAGTLAIKGLRPGQRCVIIKADRIKGRFSEVEAPAKVSIHYTADEVIALGK